MLIDGCIYTTPDFGPTSRFWREVTPRLGKLLDRQIYFLNRSTMAPPFTVDESVKVLQAPALDMRDYATEGRRLAALCKEFAVPLFISTRYTSAANVPSVFVLADNFPFMGEILVTSLMARQQAIENAALCVTLSTEGAEYLSSGYQVPASKIRVIGSGADPFADVEALAGSFATAIKEVAA